MSTIGERIDQIIKVNGLKKVQFAERLGINQSYVTHLIKGKNPPSESLVKSICREFRVSEDWLRTGEGEMHDENQADELSQILQQHGLPKFLRGLFLRYARLSPDAQKEVEAQIQSWVEEIVAQTAPVQPELEEPTEPEDYVPLSEAEIEARVEEYRALLKKGRAVRLALGHGTPPQTNVSAGTSDNGTGGTGDDIA